MSSSLLRKTLPKALWYVSTGSGCCADEALSAVGARYDLERFGCQRVDAPEEADLIIVNGLVSPKAAPHLKQLYDRMKLPRFVLALGACACSGGPFSGFPTADEIIPVDVYVPGCPPRPEAIMNGILRLQERMSVG